jgi:hypothetical protein
MGSRRCCYNSSREVATQPRKRKKNKKKSSFDQTLIMLERERSRTPTLTLCPWYILLNIRRRLNKRIFFLRIYTRRYSRGSPVSMSEGWLVYRESKTLDGCGHVVSRHYWQTQLFSEWKFVFPSSQIEEEIIKRMMMYDDINKMTMREILIIGLCCN